MANTDVPTDVFDELDQEINADSLFTNKRIAVRYRRKDIKAVVKIQSIFFPRLVPVLLLDISSKGAAILSSKRLRKNRKVCLYLLFKDGRRFAIDSCIVHSDATNRYGIKFDASNAALADHLLHTQTDLQFG